MNRSCRRPVDALLVMICSTAFAGAADVPVAPSRDDATWLREKGSLIFEDAFDREEDGNLSKAIGNGWTSATADRVPDVKQADLDGGVLKVTVDQRAGHGAHIHHDAGFTDGGAIVRFRLPSPKDSLTVGFVDRAMQGVHAGHLGYAFINCRPPQILLRDHKTGVSDQEIRKRRDPYLQAKQKLPDDLAALLAAKEKTVAWPADTEWHELVLVTEGDEMRASIDGKPVGSLRSPGFAHPVKRWFSLGVSATAWVNDVKVYRVK
jgi:hypothetical protein